MIQSAVRNDSPAPTLTSPYDLNRQVGDMLKYAGATVDGVPSGVYPPVAQSAARPEACSPASAPCPAATPPTRATPA